MLHYNSHCPYGKYFELDPNLNLEFISNGDNLLLTVINIDGNSSKIVIYNQYTDRWTEPLDTESVGSQPIAFLNTNTVLFLEAFEHTMGIRVDVVTFVLSDNFTRVQRVKSVPVCNIRSEPNTAWEIRAHFTSNAPSWFITSSNPDTIKIYEIRATLASTEPLRGPVSRGVILRVPPSFAAFSIYHCNRKFLILNCFSKPAEYYIYDVDTREYRLHDFDHINKTDRKQKTVIKPCVRIHPRLRAGNLIVFRTADRIAIVDITATSRHPVILIDPPAKLDHKCLLPSGQMLFTELRPSSLSFESSPDHRTVWSIWLTPPNMAETAIAHIRRLMNEKAKRRLRELPIDTGYREFVRFCINYSESSLTSEEAHRIN